MKYRVELWSKWSIGIDRLPINLNDDLPDLEVVQDQVDMSINFWKDDETYLNIIDENNETVLQTTLDQIGETVDSGNTFFNDDVEDFLYYKETYKRNSCISEKEFNYIPDFDDFKVYVKYLGKGKLVGLYGGLCYKGEPLELDWIGGEGETVEIKIVKKDGNKINIEINDDGELIPEEMEDD